MMQVDPEALNIVATLRRAGHTAYFAGGCVRDMLLKRSCKDFDVATSATPEEIFQLFDHCLEVGALFGVVHIVISKKNYEVATFRSESGYSDGRHPDHVERSSPEKDAERRDFTINGMFYDPMEKKVLDFVRGQEDLDARVIRAIGNPKERFKEDRLRLLRAVRFSAALNFKIESTTYDAIRSEAQNLFPSVSPERIYEELTKMAQGLNFAKAILALWDTGLLKEIFPGLDQESVEKGVHWVQQIELGHPAALTFALLMLECDAQKMKNWIGAYFVKKADKKRLVLLGEFLDLLGRNPTMQTLAHLFAQDEAMDCLKTLAVAYPQQVQQLYRLQEELKIHVDRIREKRPFISASDLMKEGIQPGPQMGSLLEEAERLAIDEELTEKSALIRRLKNLEIWPT
jgi:poly(A) polymerase